MLKIPTSADTQFFIKGRIRTGNKFHHSFFSAKLMVECIYRERVVNSTRGNLEEVNIQGLQPGTTYAVRVVGFNDHGMGESSETVLVKTETGLDIPGPVTKLDAKATSSDSILISWGLPIHIAGSITGYKLYYRQVS